MFGRTVFPVVAAQTTSPRDRLAAARRDLESLISTTAGGAAESLKQTYADVWADTESALELVYAEFVARREMGQSQDREEFLQRYPQWRERLERLFTVGELLAPAEVNGTSGIGDDRPPGYTFLEIIGQGASAIVYQARQAALNRLVAVKVFHDNSAAARKRITREGELAARLQHPNIVPIYEVGEWHGQSYLTMELVAGGTLDATEVQAKSFTQLAELLETIARAVHYAHTMGVVHRDLKPSNILVRSAATSDSDGHEAIAQTDIKIADFGLATTFDSRQSVTESIALAGTPCYMAPEQADARTERIGPRSDIYALGAMLYEFLTGQPPFRGGSILETLDLVRHTEPTKPRQMRPSIPRDLETICLKCLEKVPARRYSTAADLADDLQRFRTGQGINARPVSSLEHGWKWVRRHPAISTLTLGLMLSLCVAVVALALNYRNAEAARRTEHQLNQDLQESFAKQSIGAARALWNGGQLTALRQTLDQIPDSYRTADWAELNRLSNSHIASWTGPEYAAAKLAVNRDGTKLALRRRTGARGIDILDSTTGSALFSVPSVFPLQMEFTGDDRFLIVLQAIMESTASPVPVAEVLLDNLSREVVVWDLALQSKSRTWPVPGRGAALNRWGSRVASWHDNMIRVWDAPTGKVVAEINPEISQRFIGRFALTDDGQKLALRHGSEEIRIWNLADQRLVQTIETGPALTMGTFQFQANGERLYGFAGQLGTKPAEATMRPFIHAWDVATGSVSFQIPGRVPVVLVTSADAKLMAHLNNRAIDLYDASTGVKRATLMGHTDQIASIAFSPDGKRLYSGGLDNTLRTWDVSSWVE